MSPRRDPPPRTGEVVFYVVALLAVLAATLLCSAVWPMGFAA